MTERQGLVAGVVLVAWLTQAAAVSRADFVRFHFAPNEICSPNPTGPISAVGEWQPWRGSTRREPYRCDFRPNQFMTFRHAYTGQNVTVPLRLPPDVPLVQHVGDRVVLNYGVYSVEVKFYQDGSVDTFYNSRIGRPVFYNG